MDEGSKGESVSHAVIVADDSVDLLYEEYI